jgi:hypothetical protein
VAVLDDRAGQDREVQLALAVDGDGPHHGVSLGVAGERHGNGVDALGCRRISDGGPADAAVVVVVQVGDEVEGIHGHGSDRQSPDGTGGVDCWLAQARGERGLPG